MPQYSEEKDGTKGRFSRTTKACDRCALKKIRCVGLEDGGCESCRNSKDSPLPLCTFQDKSKKPSSPPKAYVENLERRLEAMEELLKTLTEKNRIQETAGDSESYQASSRTTSESIGNSPSGIQLESTESDDKIANDFENLTMQDERYFGRGSGLHLARSLGVFTPTASPTFIPNPTLSIVEDWLQAEDVKRNHSVVHSLPPPDLAIKLVDAYFSNVNSLSPLLHYPSFKRAWDLKFFDTESSFRGLFFSVCALGSRFVEDSRLISVEKYAAGYDYYVASRSSLTPTFSIATLFDIQASCLNVVWLLGSSTPISCWSRVGSALRRVIDVGAHRENRSRWNASPLEDQLRKRAIYVLYGLDRQVSATLGRPLALQDEDFDLEEPLNIDDKDLDEWNLKGSQFPPPPPPLIPTPIAALKCLIGLQRIMGRTMRLLYGINRGLSSQKATEAVCELDSQLNKWLLHVPDHLKWANIEPGNLFFAQSVMIHVAYYACQILVHRDFLSPGRSKLHPFPSLAICGNAARSLTHLLDTLKVRGGLEQSFFYAPFAAVTGGVVLLINVFAAKNSPNLSSSVIREAVQRCFEALHALSEKTFMAKKMEGGFKMLVSVALASNITITAPTKKRSNEEDQLPHSKSSSNNDLPPFEKQSRVSFSAERDFRPLPLTTQDLSILTFLPTPGTQTVNPILPIIPDFNWPYNPNPPTLSPADDNLLQSFYSTGTLPIPQTPINDQTSFLSTNDLLSQPTFASTSNLSSEILNDNIDSYNSGLGDYGFNFDPTIPFDWDAIGSFDFNSLSQSFNMPVDS